MLKCGADKVSVNSGAIRDPGLIAAAARHYGDQCVVLSVDAKRVDGRYHVFAKGGREDTGLDAIDWVRKGVADGAGEIVLNSIDTDGVSRASTWKCSPPSATRWTCRSSPPAARAGGRSGFCHSLQGPAKGGTRALPPPSSTSARWPSPT